DLQVLQAQCRAGPHDHGRVLRQWLDVLVQVHVDLGDLIRADARRVAGTGRVVDDHRLHRGDLTDALAADPDLVALDEALRVGELRGQAVGRYERQPVVRLVGEEHGHDDDEDRDGADQRRAGGEAADSPASHAPPPSRKLRNIRALFMETAWLPASGEVVVSPWSGVVEVVPGCDPEWSGSVGCWAPWSVLGGGSSSLRSGMSIGGSGSLARSFARALCTAFLLFVDFLLVGAVAGAASGKFAS